MGSLRLLSPFFPLLPIVKSVTFKEQQSLLHSSSTKKGSGEKHSCGFLGLDGSPVLQSLQVESGHIEIKLHTQVPGTPLDPQVVLNKCLLNDYLGTQYCSAPGTGLMHPDSHKTPTGRLSYRDQFSDLTLISLRFLSFSYGDLFLCISITRRSSLM